MQCIHAAAVAPVPLLAPTGGNITGRVWGPSESLSGLTSLSFLLPHAWKPDNQFNRARGGFDTTRQSQSALRMRETLAIRLMPNLRATASTARRFVSLITTKSIK